MNDLDQMIKNQEKLMKLYPEDQDIKSYYHKLLSRFESIKKKGD